MSNKNLAIATLKSIESTSRTRDAFRFGRAKRLADNIILMGFGFLLLNLSPVAAQTLDGVKKVPTTHKSSPKIELKGITGEFYTLKTGEVCPVWLAPDGRKYIYRANGRKYYPKSLNR